MKLSRTINKHSVQRLSLESGCVVTIGNYDGVHLGHQKILARLTQLSVELNLPAVVMTFSPSPEAFFQGDNAAPRLTTVSSRFFAMQNLGIDIMVALAFNKKLSKTSAEDFIQKYLVDGLNAKTILIGDDFKFGTGRKGDYGLLKRSEEIFGFKVEKTETVLSDDQRISSSRVRQCLTDGNFTAAKALLGRAYAITGRVTHGDKRGREWGFPTLNIPINRKPPFTGVYAVNVDGIGDKPVFGVANLGVRPTVDGMKRLLEVHLFEFNKNIYGSRVCVEFVEKIRDEKKFDSFDELKAQILRDCEVAKTIMEKRV